MKTCKFLIPVVALVILTGCGGKKKAQGFVQMATLHSIEVESISMIAEENGNDKILLRIPCTAWLGVDLDGIKGELSEANNRLVVKLPKIDVSSPKVHHEKERVLDERRSIWSSPNMAQSLKEKAEQKAQKEVAEIAMSPETLKLAKAQTERLVKCFYKQVYKQSNPDMEIVIEWMED